MTYVDLGEVNKDEVFVYLDELRDSGITNMFGAGSYIMQEFGLSKRDAQSLLVEWMESFSDRHPNG
jgi:hypothetical protein